MIEESGICLFTVKDLRMDVSIAGTPLVVKLADDDFTRVNGLMNVHELESNTGLLFRWPTAEHRSFWMKDTPIPLDIAYIAKDGKIINIEKMEPYSLKSVLSAEPAVCALEVNRGWFEENGIAPGDVVDGVFNDMPKLSEARLFESSNFRLEDDDFYYQDVVDLVVEDIMRFLPDVMPNETIEYSSEYSWSYPVDVDAWTKNWGEDEIPEFDVELSIIPDNFEESPGHPGWNIDASAGEGSYMPGNVKVELQLRPGMLFEAGFLMIIETELSNAIAHELHHLTQDGGPLERPSCPQLPNRAGNSYHDYFTSACEVPAFLIGFRAEAAKSGKPVSDLVARYLSTQVTASLITAEEAKDIAARWLSHKIWKKE